MRPICGAPLPVTGGVCVRSPGHGYEHRSAYALDNQRTTRTRPVPYEPPRPLERCTACGQVVR